MALRSSKAGMQWLLLLALLAGVANAMGGVGGSLAMPPPSPETRKVMCDGSDVSRKYYLNALEVEAEIHKTRDVNRQYNCRVEHVDGKLRCSPATEDSAAVALLETGDTPHPVVDAPKLVLHNDPDRALKELKSLPPIATAQTEKKLPKMDKPDPTKEVKSEVELAKEQGLPEPVSPKAPGPISPVFADKDMQLHLDTSALGVDPFTGHVQKPKPTPTAPEPIIIKEPKQVKVPSKAPAKMPDAVVLEGGTRTGFTDKRAGSYIADKAKLFGYMYGASMNSAEKKAAAKNDKELGRGADEPPAYPAWKVGGKAEAKKKAVAAGKVEVTQTVNGVPVKGRMQDGVFIPNGAVGEGADGGRPRVNAPSTQTVGGITVKGSHMCPDGGTECDPKDAIFVPEGMKPPGAGLNLENLPYCDDARATLAKKRLAKLTTEHPGDARTDSFMKEEFPELAPQGPCKPRAESKAAKKANKVLSAKAKRRAAADMAMAHFGIPCTTGFQYQYIDVKKTWADAEAACVGWGGHLASAQCAEENDHLYWIASGGRAGEESSGAVKVGAFLEIEESKKFLGSPESIGGAIGSGFRSGGKALAAGGKALHDNRDAIASTAQAGGTALYNNREAIASTAGDAARLGGRAARAGGTAVYENREAIASTAKAGGTALYENREAIASGAADAAQFTAVVGAGVATGVTGQHVEAPVVVDAAKTTTNVGLAANAGLAPGLTGEEFEAWQIKNPANFDDEGNFVAGGAAQSQYAPDGTKLAAAPKPAAWLGGRDSGGDAGTSTNAFKWSDGTGPMSSFTRWAAGQPASQYKGGKEDCMDTGSVMALGWNDAACGVIKPYICKKKSGEGADPVAAAVRRAVIGGGNDTEHSDGPDESGNGMWVGGTFVQGRMDPDTGKFVPHSELTPPVVNSEGAKVKCEVIISADSAVSAWLYSSNGFQTLQSRTTTAGATRGITLAVPAKTVRVGDVILVRGSSRERTAGILADVRIDGNIFASGPEHWRCTNMNRFQKTLSDGPEGLMLSYNDWKKAVSFGENGVSELGRRLGMDGSSQWMWTHDNGGHDKQEDDTDVVCGFTVPTTGSMAQIVVGTLEHANFSIWVDNVRAGSGNDFEQAYSYSVEMNTESEIVLQGSTDGTLGGLLAIISFKGKQFVTNKGWRCATSSTGGALNTDVWKLATEHGEVGDNRANADKIKKADGMYGGGSASKDARHIWTEDNSADNSIICRFRLFPEMFGNKADGLNEYLPVGAGGYLYRLTALGKIEEWNGILQLDDANAWKRIASEPARAIAAGESGLFMVGRDNSVWEATGQRKGAHVMNWRQIPHAFDFPIVAVSAGGGRLYVLFEDGSMSRRTSRRSDHLLDIWQDVPTPLDSPILAVSASPGEVTVVLKDSADSVYTSKDHGLLAERAISWNLLISPPCSKVSTAPGAKYVLGDDGKLWEATDNHGVEVSDNWRELGTVNPKVSAVKAIAASAGRLYHLGEDGYIYMEVPLQAEDPSKNWVVVSKPDIDVNPDSATIAIAANLPSRPKGGSVFAASHDHKVYECVGGDKTNGGHACGQFGSGSGSADWLEIVSPGAMSVEAAEGKLLILDATGTVHQWTGARSDEASKNFVAVTLPGKAVKMVRSFGGRVYILNGDNEIEWAACGGGVTGFLLEGRWSKFSSRKFTTFDLTYEHVYGVGADDGSLFYTESHQEVLPVPVSSGSEGGGAGGGSGWTKVPAVSGTKFRAVSCVESTIYALTQEGVILHHSVKGNTGKRQWSTLVKPSSASGVISLSALDHGNVWVVDSNGNLHASTGVESGRTATDWKVQAVGWTAESLHKLGWADVTVTKDARESGMVVVLGMDGKVIASDLVTTPLGEGLEDTSTVGVMQLRPVSPGGVGRPAENMVIMSSPSSSPQSSPQSSPEAAREVERFEARLEKPEVRGAKHERAAIDALAHNAGATSDQMSAMLAGIMHRRRRLLSQGEGWQRGGRGGGGRGGGGGGGGRRKKKPKKPRTREEREAARSSAAAAGGAEARPEEEEEEEEDLTTQAPPARAPARAPARVVTSASATGDPSAPSARPEVLSQAQKAAMESARMSAGADGAAAAAAKFSPSSFVEPTPKWIALPGVSDAKSVAAGGEDVYTLGGGKDKPQIKRWDDALQRWQCIEVLPNAVSLSASSGLLYGLSSVGGGQIHIYTGNGAGQSTVNCPDITDLDVWKNIPGPDGSGVKGMAATSRGLFAIGSDGLVYRWLGSYSKAGKWNWMRTSAFTAEPLRGQVPEAKQIRASGTRLFMVSRQGGDVYQFLQVVKSWVMVPTGASSKAKTVSVSPGRVLTCGVDGVVREWTGGMDHSDPESNWMVIPHGEGIEAASQCADVASDWSVPLGYATAPMPDTLMRDQIGETESDFTILDHRFTPEFRKQIGLSVLHVAPHAGMSCYCWDTPSENLVQCSCVHKSWLRNAAKAGAPPCDGPDCMNAPELIPKSSELRANILKLEDKRKTEAKEECKRMQAEKYAAEKASIMRKHLAETQSEKDKKAMAAGNPWDPAVVEKDEVAKPKCPASNGVASDWYTELKEVSMRGHNGVYQPGSDTVIPLKTKGYGWVGFVAKASMDITIGFSTVAKIGFQGAPPMYEVVFGAEGNTKTVIRRSSGGTALAEVSVATNPTAAVDPEHWTQYWVMVRNGFVSCGKGPVGQTVLLEYTDSFAGSGVAAKFVGLTSGGAPVFYRHVQVGEASAPAGVSRGLAFWLRADEKVYGIVGGERQPAKSTGTRVVSWVDSSGAGNSARQEKSSEMPTLVASAVNCKPAILFDGSTQSFDSSIFLKAEEGTFTAVVKAVKSEPGAAVFDIKLTPNGHSASNGPALFKNAVDGTWQLNKLEARPGFEETQFDHEAAPGFHVVTARVVSNHYAEIYVDGQRIVQGDPGLLGPRTINFIGESRGKANFGGQMAELIGFDRALGEKERHLVEGEMFEKYLTTFSGGALDFHGCKRGMACGGYVPLMKVADEAVKAITFEFWAYARNLTRQHAVATFGTNDLIIRFNGQRLCVTMFTASPAEQCFLGHYHVEQWHHIAVVVNTEGKKVVVYGDGEQQSELKFAAMPPIQLTNMTLGSTQKTLYPAFDGLLAEVRLWNGVVDGAALKTRHTMRLTGKESGLLGLWSFDLDEGYLNLWDRSVNRHHAKLLGGRKSVTWTALDSGSVDKSKCSMLKPEVLGDAPGGAVFDSAVPESGSKAAMDTAVLRKTEQAARAQAGAH